MDRIKTIFLRGLLTILPIAVTIYILYAGVLIFENFLGGFIKYIMPEHTYIPGLGFALTIALIFLFGLLLNNFILQAVMKKVEHKLKAIPLIKAVYSPLRDLMNLFSGGKQGLQGVVLVEWSPTGPSSVGLVTRDKFDDIPQLAENDLIAVFIPFSYGVGGYTMLFKRSQVKPLNIPVERALQLAITGWVKAVSYTHLTLPTN